MRQRNSLSLFPSYCPAARWPLIIAVRCVSTSPLDVAISPKASPRSGLTFSCCEGGTFRRRNTGKISCPGVILSIHFPVMNRSPYGDQRTSCVLYIPRILSDARYSQHAWQGFHPVHPTKEGAGPLCWILPLLSARATA